MWELTVPWWHLVVRAVILYLAVTLLLSATGRRQLGRIGPFDLVLLLIVSSSISRGLTADDFSIPAALISAATLISVNYMIVWLTFHFPAISRMVEGRATILIRDGIVDKAKLRKVMITRHELRAALRAHGCASPLHVRYAMLENNGSITVIREKETTSRSGRKRA